MSEIANRLLSQKRSWAHPGSGHDRLVRLAVTVLPICILVLGAFLVIAPLLMGGDVSFVLDKNKVAISPERLRLERADYRGDDTKGRPFHIHAGSAVQKSSADPVVQLNSLSAEIRLESGPATVKADTGHYDMTNEKVAVDGPIRFQTSNGYTLNTENATLDLKSRTLESGGAAKGDTPMGVFSGDKLTADLENNSVALSGNARLRIFPKRAKRP